MTLNINNTQSNTVIFKEVPHDVEKHFIFPLLSSTARANLAQTCKAGRHTVRQITASEENQAHKVAGIFQETARKIAKRPIENSIDEDFLTDEQISDKKAKATDNPPPPIEKAPDNLMEEVNITLENTSWILTVQELIDSGCIESTQSSRDLRSLTVAEKTKLWDLNQTKKDEILYNFFERFLDIQTHIKTEEDPFLSEFLNSLLLELSPQEKKERAKGIREWLATHPEQLHQIDIYDVLILNSKGPISRADVIAEFDLLKNGETEELPAQLLKKRIHVFLELPEEIDLFLDESSDAELRLMLRIALIYGKTHIANQIMDRILGQGDVLLAEDLEILILESILLQKVEILKFLITDPQSQYSTEEEAECLVDIVFNRVGFYAVCSNQPEIVEIVIESERISLENFEDLFLRCAETQHFKALNIFLQSPSMIDVEPEIFKKALVLSFGKSLPVEIIKKWMSCPQFKEMDSEVKGQVLITLTATPIQDAEFLVQSILASGPLPARSLITALKNSMTLGHQTIPSLLVKEMEFLSRYERDLAIFTATECQMIRKSENYGQNGSLALEMDELWALYQDTVIGKLLSYDEMVLS